MFIALVPGCPAERHIGPGSILRAQSEAAFRSEAPCSRRRQSKCPARVKCRTATSRSRPPPPPRRRTFWKTFFRQKRSFFIKKSLPLYHHRLTDGSLHRYHFIILFALLTRFVVQDRNTHVLLESFYSLNFGTQYSNHEKQDLDQLSSS